MKINTIYLSCLAFFLLSLIGCEDSLPSEQKPSVIVINDSTISRLEKEALIILPGLGDSKKGRKHQFNYFKNKGFDLFIPDYIDKISFDSTVNKFTQFYNEQHLEEYKKVHVFSYILGSWVVNTFINKNGIGNISTIIYDRSPLQERAPAIVVENIPRIGKLVSGEVIKELSGKPYPPIVKGGVKIGIIVESKATPLMRHFKKETIAKGIINWEELDFNQDHDDLIFTRLNHDEMYITFDEIGPDILHFLKKGRFKKDTRRKWFGWDPFLKY